MNKFKTYSKFFSEATKQNLKTANKTALLPFSNLLNTLPYRDILLVGNENLKFTVSEFDSYSTAFSKHLLEMGFEPKKHKIFLWTDIQHTAETLCSIFGAWKAGFTIVYSSNEELDSIKDCIEESDVVVFSPFTLYNDKKRLDLFNSFNINNKHVIQISHKSISGMIKYKQAFNYSTGFNSSINLPIINNNDTAYYIDKSVLTHGDLYSKIPNDRSGNVYLNTVNSVPVTIPSSLIHGFISQVNSQSYTVFPGSYSLKDIIAQVKLQKSNSLFIEDEILNLELPQEKLQEISKSVESIESLYIIGQKKPCSLLEKCFSKASVYEIDNKNLERL